MLALGGVILWGALRFSPLRPGLEAAMATHMAVQIPLLIAAGVLIAPALRNYEPAWLAEVNRWGIPGILLAIFTHLFWMLPRSLDTALADPWVELAKFVTLPLLAGLPLGLSWPRLPTLGRGFVWVMLTSMLGAIGAIYLTAPTRLCAYYRFDQQAAAGWTLIDIAIALVLLLFVAAFTGLPWPWPAVRRHDGGQSAGRRAISPRSPDADRR